MKNGRWKVYGFWVALSLGVGALSGWLSRDGMEVFQQTINQPPLSPPKWLFPIVWSILYILMGIGAARVSLTPASQSRSRGLNLFVLQLAVNFLWSPIFFNLQAFGFAFIWLLILWMLVLWMILTFQQTDSIAAWLQLPYLAWLTFAAYLNLGVWLLN